MTEAPGEVDEGQLEELYLKSTYVEEKKQYHRRNELLNKKEL